MLNITDLPFYVLHLHADDMTVGSGGGALALFPSYYYQSNTSFFAAEMVTFTRNMATYHGEEYAFSYDPSRDLAKGQRSRVM
jgi:hypothetical protein